ncbi:mycothiol synthase, partial [Leucobacter sp. M11]|uniref:mycothiol synthase n=1 Tax=Leucobacter sp. M11 TaxID=2993565 RepID=UPI002D7FDF0D
MTHTTLTSAEAAADVETQRHAEQIIAAAAAHDGQEPISDQARVDARSGDRALRLILGADDGSAEPVPVGVAVLGGGELDLVIDPAHRGRGHATRALDALLREEPGPLRAWAHGEQPTADRLLTGAGFAPVRTLLRLALDPALLPEPTRPAAPSGFAFDTFSPADAPEWLRVNALAFASHPEQGRMTQRDLDARQAEAWFDAEDFLLLRPEGTEASAPGGERPGPGDALAGFNWLKVVRSEAAGAPTVEGEIYAIGVDPGF